jgi:hypothetical protein
MMGAQPAAQLMALTLCLPHAVAAAAHSGGLLSPYDGVVVSAIVDTGADGETVVHLVPREQLLSSLDTDGWAPREAAWGVFNDSSYYHVGWGKLEIHTNPKLADEACATAAGHLEGKITANRIYQHAMNSGMGPDLRPEEGMLDFIAVNNEWIQLMSRTAQRGTPADRTYWHHVNLINSQMKGLHAGYMEAANASAGELEPLIFESILYLNMGDELGDFAGFKPGGGFDRQLPTFGDLSPFTEASKCSVSAWASILPVCGPSCRPVSHTDLCHAGADHASRGRLGHLHRTRDLDELRVDAPHLQDVRLSLHTEWQPSRRTCSGAARLLLVMYVYSKI